MSPRRQLASRAAAWLSGMLCLGTLAAQAPSAGASDGSALSLLATAEQRLAKGAVEDAVLLLWEAERALQEMPEGAGRDAAAGALQALALRADPLRDDRRAAFTAIARIELEVATAYRKKKWFALARDRLVIVARFDPAAAQKESRTLPAAPAGPDAASVGPAVRSLLGATTVVEALPGWNRAGEVVTGPATVDPATTSYYLLGATHGDGEIAFSLRIGAGTGGGGLLFGATSAADCCVLGVYQVAGGGLAVSLQRSIAGVRFEALGEHHQPNASPEGRHRVVLRVRGPAIEVHVDGGEPLRAVLPTACTGRIGFFAPGHSPTAAPLQFEGLTLGPLPVEPPSGAAAARQEAVFAAVAAAEAQLADKQTEAGILALRAAWADLRALPAGVVRDQLDASVAERLRKVDPVHARRSKAAVDVAAQLAGLAQRHRADGRLRCAEALLREAAAFDPNGIEAALAGVRAELAAAEQKEREARKAELLPPVVAGDLVGPWFGAGVPLHHGDRSWRVAPEAATATLADHRWSGLLPRAPRLGGHLRVHVQLPRSGSAAGFLFDARGNNDCSFCALARGDDGVFLEVHRYFQGSWQRLARQPVPMPAWRRDGWLQLEIDDGPAGVRGRAYDVEVFVERGQLGAVGPIGLAASDAGEGAATFDLRGLTVVE